MSKKYKYAFSEYKSKRASDDIADEIKKAILSKKLSIGDRLPPERDLAEQFNVSRMTIREALRLLETKGLIVVKKGSTGGSFVQPASAEQIANIILDKLLVEGLTHDHVTEARGAMECGIVKCVIEKATQKDLERIEKNLEESGNIPKAITAEHIRFIITKIIEFHQLLAEATHNPPLIIFNHANIGWAHRKLPNWNPKPEELVSHVASHRDIFEAIKAKDVDLSLTLTEQHIRESMKGYKYL